MFKRRLSRLRTTSFVIFVVSIVYFLEAFLRYFLITNKSEIQYALHKNSRILLARLARTKHHANQHAAEFRKFEPVPSANSLTCQITVVDIENRIVDSNGTYCQIEDVDKNSKCCKTKLNFEHCKCCAKFTHCVGSCLKHEKVYPDTRSLSEGGLDDWAVDGFFKNLPVAFLKYSEFSLQIWNEFDLCNAVCRTNSGSVKDGNLYLEEAEHYCYVELEGDEK